MSTDHQAAAAAAEPFESLSRLRAEHVDLMRAVRRDGNDLNLVGRIREFIDRIRATGTRLDSPADRDAAQNIIGYWASYLFTAGGREALSAAPPALEPFDQMNAPDLHTSPYQGLGPFGGLEAGGYFGREEATKDLLDRLRDNPAILVVGPKGVGKTSFVAAGAAQVAHDDRKHGSCLPGR
jgi:hypothetical protein